MKDFTMRCLIAQDQPWWNTISSEWKISSDHPWCKENEYSPGYWEDRVINLCSYDITQSNFGLSFTDLMEMDVATFEKIEKAVHKLAEKQSAAIPQDMKEKYDQANGIMRPNIKMPGMQK